MRRHRRPGSGGVLQAGAVKQLTITEDWVQVLVESQESGTELTVVP